MQRLGSESKTLGCHPVTLIAPSWPSGSFCEPFQWGTLVMPLIMMDGIYHEAFCLIAMAFKRKCWFSTMGHRSARRHRLKPTKGNWKEYYPATIMMDWTPAESSLNFNGASGFFVTASYSEMSLRNMLQLIRDKVCGSRTCLFPILIFLWEHPWNFCRWM